MTGRRQTGRIEFLSPKRLFGPAGETVGMASILSSARHDFHAARGAVRPIKAEGISPSRARRNGILVEFSGEIGILESRPGFPVTFLSAVAQRRKISQLGVEG